MDYITYFREGDRVSGVYLCKNKVNAKTKVGKTYYSLTLQDKTGTVDAKVWDLSSGIDHFEAMDYIHIEGEVTVYQGVNQVNIRRIRRAQEGEYLPEDYLPSSPFDMEEMKTLLLAFVKSVKNEKLRRLLESFFVDDAAFWKEFCSHSAAKSVHHSFVGGLLQHTLRVTQMCDFYCVQYPVLKRDLLIAGALLHDIGKTREISAFPFNDYTDEGQLLGHIVMGYEMVMSRIREIDGFPRKLANELGHLILSHHGEFEFGSPKKPSIAEAIALHFADNTDAKMELVTELLDTAVDGNWLGYNKLIESNFRKTSDVE